MQEYLKHLLIRTPFEKPAQRVQSLLIFQQYNQHPELQEIYKEPQRIEQALQHIITPSSNCIDIGCHLGSTLSKILHLSPQGKHIAFEPIPYKALWLKQKFPEVEIQQIALGDTLGEVTFYINSNSSGFSSLRPHRASKKDTFQEITVRRNKLDNLLDPSHRIDFIKLDVEGGELFVLRGAVNTLSRYHPVLLFECTRSGLTNFDISPRQVFEFLTEKHSYSIFLIKEFINNGNPLDFEQFQKALQYPFQAFNFIAKPNSLD